LPYPAVDALAQQVGVAAVAGVLIDPVNPNLPDGDALPAKPRAQVRVPGQHRIGCFLLAGKVGECVRDLRLPRNRPLESGITRSVQPRCLVSRRDPVAPGPFGLGKMANQAQQGQGRRRHRPARQLPRVQPLTQAPVTRDERDELNSLLEAMNMPVDTLAGLNVQS